MTRLRISVPAALIAVVLAVASPASAAVRSPAAGSGPVAVAVVMPITVPPTTTGLLDAEALTTYTRQGGLLDRELDAVAGTTATVGLDPMIPASIRVLGTSAPAEAVDFLARLQSMPNEVFLLGYADADPALAVLAGMSNEFAPLGFGFAIDPANFGPAVTPGPTPQPTSGTSVTATPDPDATTPPDGPPPLPTTADLLDWPTTLPAIAWPAEGTVTADGLAGLTGLGYTEVLLSSSNVSTTGTARVGLGEIDGLIADETLTTAVRDLAYAATDATSIPAQQSLDLALQAAASRSPGATMIATLDRRWPFGTVRLAEALATIAASPSSRLASLTEVLNGTRSSAALAEPADESGAARAVVLDALSVAAQHESGYLRIADDPTVITEPRRLALLGLSAVGWRVDTAGWDAATADQLAAAQATLNSVQIVEGLDQLLVSDISSLRVQVTNALPVGVTVVLSVRPLRPLLHVNDSSVRVEVEPDSTVNAAVPVEAIINGDVTVRAQLRSTSGQTLGAPRLLKVVVQAGWETVGTLVAGTLVVLIFGGGLVRAVLRRRRSGAPDAVDAPGAVDD
jgi:hypothetical protein